MFIVLNFCYSRTSQNNLKKCISDGNFRCWYRTYDYKTFEIRLPTRIFELNSTPYQNI